MKKLLFTTVLALAAAAPMASAQFVINTAEPERPIHVGIRAGVNVSNTASNEHSFMPDNIKMRVPDWGAGFTVGAVVDMRIRECFAVQPGIFYSTHSYGFDRCSVSGAKVYFTDTDVRSRYIEVPVLLSFRVNMSSNFQLQFDLGPYFQWGVGGTEKYAITTYSSKKTQEYERDYFGSGDDENYTAKKFDWGFKMGVGLEVCHHFYIGAHYMAGCRNLANKTMTCTDPAAPKDLKSGVNLTNKQWQFTVGYTF